VALLDDGLAEKTPDLAHYYPTDALVTDRGIIYFLGGSHWCGRLELMARCPSATCAIHGTVLDETGAKMSKSKGKRHRTPSS